MNPHCLLPGPDRVRAFCLTKFAGLLAIVPLLLAGSGAMGQQPSNYPQYGYGYGSQSAPAPPPGYAQPQYAPAPPAPQYAQPQYSAAQPEPQYSQPGYGAQPQYGYQQPYAAPEPAAPPGDSGEYGEPEQPVTPQPALGADRLEQLLAPVALYPDSLLAQILTAATYPAQVAVASQWLQQMRAQGYGSPDQVAEGADAQNWDPSVKALTAFPQVLEMMNQNLQWTTELGNAYFNQPQDVMQTVQVLRQRAANAGNLESAPQESVNQEQGAIELAPPSPAVVYVPSYDPWAVYGTPIAPYPGFSILGGASSFFLGGPLRFGFGVAMAAFERMPWGWLGWGLDWLGHAVLFNHGAYFTHSRSVADWGFPHGGARAYGGWYRGGRWDGQQYARAGDSARAGYGARGAWNNGYAPHGAYSRGEAYNRRTEFASRGEYGAQNRFSRGYASPGYNYGRGQQPYNGPTPMFSHPQTYAGTYGRYGSGYASRPGQSYAAPSRSYSSPNNGYRATQRTYERSFAEPPSRSFAQNERGFGSFSHGDSSAGGRAPKSSSHSFFGGRSSGGFRAERGGGGHSKSSGHSRGGGHSGGGGRRRR